jgi:hypothetical protein
LLEDTGITKSQSYGRVGESATEVVLKLFAQSVPQNSDHFSAKAYLDFRINIS